MSLEVNKAIIRKLNNVYNTQNWDLLNDLVAIDYIDHTNKIQGREPLKTLMKMGKLAFPDWHETIEDIIAEGDKVWVFLTYTATHTGEWFGVAPTGNKMETTSVDVHRIVNGKVAEYWNVTNNLNMFTALGLVKNTEEGEKFFKKFILEDVK
ncbi:MAG: ester cyclase [Asgard group archaeon]|nr:ester cyclase [Asgard group archaeon]